MICLLSWWFASKWKRLWQGIKKWLSAISGMMMKLKYGLSSLASTMAVFEMTVILYLWIRLNMSNSIWTCNLIIISSLSARALHPVFPVAKRPPSRCADLPVLAHPCRGKQLGDTRIISWLLSQIQRSQRNLCWNSCHGCNPIFYLNVQFLSG